MKRISLKTLLILLLMPLFMSLGAVLFTTGLGNTRDFLEQQLQGHAQDAATALAIRLAPAFAAHDNAAIANTVDGLFDNGYYSVITLTNPQGNVILHREEALRIENVPGWFIDWLPLTTREGEAEVSNGWKRGATIRIVSHPGHAYLQLWQNAADTLFWTLAFCAATALLLVLALTRALASLENMEKLAMQVSEGHFPQLDTPPRIRELDHIGHALNRMSSSVARMLESKRQQIDQLREDLHHDPATGLANRDYFIAALDAARTESGGSAGLSLLQITGLDSLNAHSGREAGDHLVKKVGMAVKSIAERYHAFAARPGGSQFALFMEACDSASLEDATTSLTQAVNQALTEMGTSSLCAVYAGTAMASESGYSVLLARADAALRDACLGPSGTTRSAGNTAQAALGREHMRHLLREAIQDIRLNLSWQPLVACAGWNLIHAEAYARLPDGNGQNLPAGAFITLAEEEGLIFALDQHILTSAMLSDSPAPRAVNISDHTLSSPDFIAWLRNSIAEPGKLYIECTLGRASTSPTAMEALKSLKLDGFRVVLDHFVPSFTAMELMSSLRPDWVKVEGGLCRHARDNAGTRKLLSSLCEFSHEHGVQVAATGVEREEDIIMLQELGVDGIQGKAIQTS